MSKAELHEKRITELENILLICGLDPTISFLSMARMIVAQIKSTINKEKK